MKNNVILLLVLLLSVPSASIAQAVSTQEADSIQSMMIPPEAAFSPTPRKATLMALVPGLGQIYNRKYWKLPFVYGAFMGCFYAINWNQRNYADYRQAYFDIMSNDPENNRSWVAFIPNGRMMDEDEQNTYINNSQFVNNRLKAGKDSFRKYRDLSIIISVGVYAISIIDAYVDAQLFDFDISPDLSMHVEPVYTPKTSVAPSNYGINCSFTF